MKKLLSILLVVAMLTAFALPAIATEAIKTTEPTAETEYDIQITSDIVIDERIRSDKGRYYWNEYGKLDVIVAGKEFKSITLSKLSDIVGEVYGWCYTHVIDDQLENSWTVGSTHECEVEIRRSPEDILVSIPVTVTVQDIIESIDAEPITGYEGGFGDPASFFAVITYKDGTTDRVHCTAPIGWEWPTEIGTYEKTVRLYNSNVEIPVIVHVVPFPVDVQITSDIVIDEKIHDNAGHYPWYEYGKLDAIVNGKEFKGITTNELRDAILEAGSANRRCQTSWDDHQYEELWKVGSTYECCIAFRQMPQELGVFWFAAYTNVTVQETNIESIVANPITYYEDGSSIDPNYHRPTAVVTYKDGSTEEIPLMLLVQDYPTEVGDHVRTGYAYGCVEVPVTLHVLPCESEADVDIQVTSDIVIDGKMHDAWGYYPWSLYGKFDAIVAGKEFKGITLNELEQAANDAFGECRIKFSDTQIENLWTVGNTYVCSLEVYQRSEETGYSEMILEIPVNVAVQDLIESITVEPITIYADGSGAPNEYTAVLTYKDGTIETAPMYFRGALPTEIGTHEVTGYVYDYIEVPVTIHVVAQPAANQDEITVEDGVATVPDSAVEITEGEDVIIDVTGTAEKAHSVVLGAETVDKIADAEAPVEVKLPDASLSFDKTAIGSINEQAGESPVTIVAKKVAESTLNAQQTAALEKTKVCAVLTVEAFAGKTKITDFGGGKVTISIPFELPEGKEGKDFYVAYVADDGTVTAMPTTYADGKLTFETTHFSSYVVVDKSAAAEAAPSSPQTGDSSHILLFTALMVMSAAALAVCTTKRRAF